MSGDGVDPLLAVGAIAAAALAGAALALRLSPRVRAAAMLGATLLTPALLLAEIWDSDQIASLRDRPALAIAAIAVGAIAVAAGGLLFARVPWLLPVGAVLTVPFRIPIAAGGTTSSLLVPLYAVIGAGVLAHAVPRLAGRRVASDRDDADPPGRTVRVLLAVTIVLYAVQATYSDDFERALQQVVFFYVPFALLTTLLVRFPWDRTVLVRCLAVLAGLAVVFVGIGFVEYATKHLFLNPKVIASNQFETYFRVNSLFFDPNIYGRFLAIVMLLLTSVLLWSRAQRVIVGTGLLLALLWAGLVLTLSQSSFTALLAGLLVLAALRWGRRPAAIVLGAGLVAGIVVAIVAPGQVGLQRSANAATSGRADLIKGGLQLFKDAPIEGHGSGSFRREYRRSKEASNQRATAASHTIPITVAAEQGIVGLAVYLALLATALALLLTGVRSQLERMPAAADAGGGAAAVVAVAVARAGIAAAFVALLVHTLMYAAFLEDPLAWVLLGAGIGLVRRP